VINCRVYRGMDRQVYVVADPSLMFTGAFGFAATPNAYLVPPSLRTCLPFSVSRYFCNRLLGFPGMVYSTIPAQATLLQCA